MTHDKHQLEDASQKSLVCQSGFRYPGELLSSLGQHGYPRCKQQGCWQVRRCSAAKHLLWARQFLGQLFAEGLLLAGIGRCFTWDASDGLNSSCGTHSAHVETPDGTHVLSLEVPRGIRWETCLKFAGERACGRVGCCIDCSGDGCGFAVQKRIADWIDGKQVYIEGEPLVLT